MEYTKLQEVALGSDLSAEGDDFENASARKRKRQEKRAIKKSTRQAKRATRKATRQQKRATKVAKRNPAKAARLQAKSKGNKSKASKLKSVKSSIEASRKAEVREEGNDVEIAPIQTEEGSVQPLVSDSEAYTPQVVEPIQEGNEIFEPEVAESGEVLAPEIVETNEEPVENQDGSIEVGEETIEPELSANGEVYEPEVLSQYKSADGEDVYRILRYNKIPATMSADGEVIMPYKMANGSVVLTDKIYSSATGEIYKNASGDTVVREAKTIKGGKESTININLPDNKWAKYAVWTAAIIGAAYVGTQIWKAVKSAKK